MSKSIINGIDVSECPLYDKNTGCYHTFNGECIKDSCAVYKLLLKHKRLQKENEELKKYQYTQEYLQSEIEKRQKALEEIRNIISGDYEILDPQAKRDIKKLINEVLNDRN